MQLSTNVSDMKHLQNFTTGPSSLLETSDGNILHSSERKRVVTNYRDLGPIKMISLEHRIIFTVTIL